MNIMTIADTESKALWDYYRQNPIRDVDLILSCGDLDPRYLSFLVTCSNLPLLYVHGNHDDCYKKTPPEGCICIDDDLYVHDDIRILGLGGSMKYRDGAHMYTEQEMCRRVRKLNRKIKRYGGFDILLTHAPAKELGDLDDLPHQGFAIFRELIETYSPRYMIHGHVHASYGTNLAKSQVYSSTTIINSGERSYITY